VRREAALRSLPVLNGPLGCVAGLTRRLAVRFMCAPREGRRASNYAVRLRQPVDIRVLQSASQLPIGSRRRRARSRSRRRAQSVALAGRERRSVRATGERSPPGQSSPKASPLPPLRRSGGATSRIPDLAAPRTAPVAIPVRNLGGRHDRGRRARRTGLRRAGSVRPRRRPTVAETGVRHGSPQDADLRELVTGMAAGLRKAPPPAVLSFWLDGADSSARRALTNS